MNKKGQSLITFVIILPIIILLFGMIIELSLITYHKRKIISVTKTIIANCIEEDKKNDIMELYDRNGIKVQDLEIDYTNGLHLMLTSNVESFLGEIIGQDEYEIKVDLRGYQENNKIYYEKG